MRNINEMANYFKEFEVKTINNIAKAQKETAKIIETDVKSLAPFDTGLYEESIQTSATQKKQNIISTEIFTDATVESKAGNVYNLGFLLENGTDMHAIPNAFGFGYTTGHIGNDGMWHKGTMDKDWHPGTIAQPHFKPALNDNEYTYLENIKRAVKEAKNG